MMGIEEKHSCEAMMYNRGTFAAIRPHPCKKTASICRDGKWYCKTHDPEAVAARRKASDERYAARYAAEKVKWRSIASAPALAQAVKLILALDGQPPVSVDSKETDKEFPAMIQWVVRLDPQAKKQLEAAIALYEGKE